MGPTNLFSYTKNFWSFLRFPISDGIVPAILLWLKLMRVSSLHFSNCAGSSPDIWFVWSASSCKADKFPKLRGMFPVNEFHETSRSVNFFSSQALMEWYPPSCSPRDQDFGGFWGFRYFSVLNRWARWHGGRWFGGRYSCRFQVGFGRRPLLRLGLTWSTRYNSQFLEV